MGATANSKLLTETSKNVVNRNAGTITKNRLVGFGTATGGERAIDSLHVAGVAKTFGAIDQDVETGKSTTLWGPGSIVPLESDGSGVIAYGDYVIAVAGASLAAGGRVKKLPATAGTYYIVGRHVRPGADVAATAGALALVELMEPRPYLIPA
jgi:hypothetical protein